MQCVKTTGVSLALAAVALLSAANAHGWCRTSVCGDAASTQCSPPSANDCGTPLFWSPTCFAYSVQEDASVQIDLATTESVLEQAFAAWSTATCDDGSSPAVNVTNAGTVGCDKTEYNSNSGNANIVVFRETSWPYGGQGNTLALTTVTFNLDDGEIYDADLEINAADITLTTGDAGIEYDLLSIVTHEAGHMLGIAHSTTPTATMTVQYVPGDTSLRTLDPDDAAAICAAYPGGPLESCDSTARHGFSRQCASDEPEDDGCSVGDGPAPGDDMPPWWPVGGGLLLFALTRHRARQH